MWLHPCTGAAPLRLAADDRARDSARIIRYVEGIDGEADVSTWRFTRGVLMVAGPWLFSSSARAESAEVEPIALRYEATGPCPSEPEFVAAVRKYTTRWSRVPDGTPSARTIRVRIAVKTSSVLGKLVVANASETVSERELEGPTCKRVSNGLAIMVALAIDARAAGAPAAPSKEDASPPVIDRGEPTDERQPEVPVPRGSVPTASTDDRRPDVPPVRRRPVATGSTPRRASEGIDLSLDLRVETSSAVLRGAVPGVGASLKVEPSSSASPLGRWKPSVGLGVRQSFPKERTMRGGSAEFLWTAAGLRLCPLRFGVGAAVELSPCAEMDIGVLHASADGFAAVRRLSSFWLDLGGSIWTAVHLSDRVFFSSTVLMTAPVNRQPFVLSSGRPIASVPPVGVLCGLGVGVKL